MLAAFALLIAACGSDDDDSADTGSTTTAAEGADFSSLSGTLNGSGSTFQKTFDEAAIAGFAEASAGRHRQLRRRRFGQGQERPRRPRRVDFAGTDSLVKPEDMPKYAARRRDPLLPDGGGADHGLVQPARRRQAAARASTRSAKIFSRKIKKWNDAAIAATTPASTCRTPTSSVAHRSDASGHDEQLHQVPRRPRRPTTGRSAAVTRSTGPPTRRPGTATRVSRRSSSDTEGAIGYVDLADADGREPAARARSRTRPASSSPRRSTARPRRSRARRSAPDLTYNPLNASGASAYPITVADVDHHRDEEPERRHR